MTQEEKAKRYDEALERAENIYNEIAIPSATTKGICTYIFPELAGSEDERIRKALLNEFIHLQSKGYKFAGLEGEDIISWLEKQGMPAKYHDICDTCVRQPTCQSDCFLQQSEQKPTEWSEEDEYCRHQLIVFCENCMVQDAGAKRCAHWLKSLKQRIG